MWGWERLTDFSVILGKKPLMTRWTELDSMEVRKLSSSCLFDPRPTLKTREVHVEHICWEVKGIWDRTCPYHLALRVMSFLSHPLLHL
ncbi:hypothetical protein JZ751_020011 [Albula glossodonta]|uniref:Uncharacterized protein n=1 Tax=Albula glossodonta TaxID=121402 RepID=A0A8T2NKQ0_9TELE|nr:hypothetical protein JZ751_020011 [Albula glossodonta]